MSRLLAFGCSFTNYRWSTWADCLAPEFDQFENWAQSGGGNHYIFNSVMEADQRRHFDSNDTVIVCWTNISRDDRYVDGRWHTLGNIFTAPIYDSKYLRNHYDQRGYLIRDLAYIKAVKTLLESRPGVTWRFLSMSKLIDDPIPQDIADVYNDVLDSILPGYDTTVFAGAWPKTGDDPHPSPAEHLAYLDCVLPGWVTKAETRVIMLEESVNLRKDPKRSGMTKVTRL